VIGPAAASALAGWLSWRVVFLALLPLVALAAVLALPALSGGPPDHAAGGAEPRGADGGAEPRGAEAGTPRHDDRVRDAVVLVAGAALVLGGLGAHQPALAAALVVVGGLLGAWAFVRLVPEGTLSLHPGLPAAIAVRGILTFAFFGTDAYVSLAATEAHHAPTWVAGLALTGATLAWTTGAWVQDRLVVARGPRWLVRRGFAVLAAGIALTMLALGPVPVGFLVAAWAVGGLGMGLSYAPISATVLGEAAPGQEGTASASLQLTDVLGVSLGTGVGGVFVALGDGRGWATASSLTIAFAIALAVALGGLLAATRLPRRLPGTADAHPASSDEMASSAEPASPGGVISPAMRSADAR
jgi:MFS family permease